MLFRSQIIAFVAAKGNKRYMNTRVIIWDDYQLRQIEEIKVSYPVIAVRLRRDKVVVVMQNSVNMYQLEDLDFMGTIQTVENPTGIVAVNTSDDSFVLATLSDESANTVFIQMLNNTRTSRTIRCHTLPIS